MLVWLASYPRSGNTLTRALLNRCFGLATRSLDNRGDDRVLSGEEVRAVVGHYSGGPEGEELIRAAQQSPDVHVLKTHEAPPTDDPVLHIVRDGRAAVVSYCHYLRDIEGIDVPVEQVLRGEVYAGSWSDHFRTLSAYDNRLMVRYEDIVADPDGMAQQIGAFIGRPPSGTFDLSFDQMKATHPRFFRSGRNDTNVAELAPHMDLYRQLHGDVAAELGYPV